MEWVDFIQIVLLLWLIERVSIERRRYKIGIDAYRGKYLGFVFVLWILCRDTDKDYYSRDQVIFSYSTKDGFKWKQ